MENPEYFTFRRCLIMKRATSERGVERGVRVTKSNKKIIDEMCDRYYLIYRDENRVWSTCLGENEYNAFWQEHNSFNTLWNLIMGDGTEGDTYRPNDL